MDQEHTIWSGTPSQYTNLKTYIACTAFATIWMLGSLRFTQSSDDGDYSSSSSPMFFTLLIAGIIVPLLIALWHAWRTRSTHYTLTNQRLITQKGVFTRHTDELELYRVRDYQIEQSFFYRLFGLGTIILETSDRSHPTLILQAVSHAEKLRDQIREHVEIRRNQGGGIRDIEIG